MHYNGRWHGAILRRSPAGYRLWFVVRALSAHPGNGSVSDRFRYGFQAMCRTTGRDGKVHPNSSRHAVVASRVSRPPHRDKSAVTIPFPTLCSASESCSTVTRKITHYPNILTQIRFRQINHANLRMQRFMARQFIEHINSHKLRIIHLYHCSFFCLFFHDAKLRAIRKFYRV